MSFNLSLDLLQKTMHIFLFSYLFLLFFPHTTSLREISFWLAFLSWITLRANRQGPFVPLNPVTVSLLVFVLITLLSSLLGEAPLENLRNFKGEILAVFILFLITVTEYTNLDRIKKILLSPVIAYAVCTMLILIESFQYGFTSYWDLSVRNQTWLAGYTEKVAVLFPLAIGYFLIAKNNLRYLLLFILPIALGIIALSRDFAVLLVALLVVMINAFFVYPKNYRKWITGFLTICLISFVVGAYLNKDTVFVDELKLKYNMIIHPLEELKKPDGLSNRMQMWRGAVDVIAERPLLGYGWGMRKYARIANGEKFMGKWKVENPYLYKKYIDMNKDNFIMPHNIVLELAIQSGVLGVASLFAFIGIYLVWLLRSSKGLDHIGSNFVIILVCGVIFSYFAISFLDDDIWKTSWRILFVVLGAGMISLKKE